MWVCFDPKIILDPECHKKRNTNVYVGPGMQIPTQTSLNPSAREEKLSDFAFPRITHFGSSTLLPTVKACFLWWQCPKDCLDPKVLTSPPNMAPPLSSPSSRCCCSASPRGCPSTAPSICLATDWSKQWSSVESEGRFGNQFQHWVPVFGHFYLYGEE